MNPSATGRKFYDCCKARGEREERESRWGLQYEKCTMVFVMCVKG